MGKPKQTKPCEECGKETEEGELFKNSKYDLLYMEVCYDCLHEHNKLMREELRRRQKEQ